MNDPLELDEHVPSETLNLLDNNLIFSREQNVGSQLNYRTAHNSKANSIASSLVRNSADNSTGPKRAVIPISKIKTVYEKAK